MHLDELIIILPQKLMIRYIVVLHTTTVISTSPLSEEPIHIKEGIEQISPCLSQVCPVNRYSFSIK